MWIIGITGGVGSGKTEILSYIQSKYRASVIFADKVAHLLQQPGQICYRPLLTLLGRDILSDEKQEDSPIDRGKMATEIFRNPDLLQQVNAIVHPAVRRYVDREIQEASEKGERDFLFIEAALLIEAGYGAVVDELWYIYADEKVRMNRLCESRKYPEEKIRQIMKEQLPEWKFRQECQFVVDNSGSLEDAFSQIDKKMGEYLCRKQ